MKLLIVARKKKNGFAPFVTEQVDALQRKGIECRYFPMEGKGIRGYLRQLPALKKCIQTFGPDIIHAHYGLCGLFANLQRRVPVVTTYHGSDINDKSVLRFSRLSIRLSAFNIFVSRQCVDIARPKKNFDVIPCGINLDEYPLVEKSDARKLLGLKDNRKYVLFSGSFDNRVKNAPLAKEAVSRLPGVELLEFKGYSRHQVPVLFQAVDVLLITSHTEGSPQVVKEALACNCPIVSVDVGDVRERTQGVNGCWIVSYSSNDIAEALKKALGLSVRTNGREAIERNHLANDTVANRINKVYEIISC